MITSFRHAGLKEMYEGNPRRIESSLRKRVATRLAALDAAGTIEDLKLPAYRLHELKGERAGTWSVQVSGNWRMTFRFEDGNVYDLDFEDYH